MHRILYYILYGILYIISLLPLGILYLWSDGIRWMLFDIIQYRKAIVYDNVRKSFPEKPEEEIQGIIKKFQRSFCDQWVELIKSISISESSLRTRVTGNWDMLNQYDHQDVNCFIMLGHQFNWEWASNSCQVNIPQIAIGIYMPINNKVIDLLILKIRGRWGAGLVSAKTLHTDLKQYDDQNYVLGVLADQSPGKSKNLRFFQFMNRPTAFTIGPAKGAATQRSAVVFATITKLRRGYYHAHLEEMVRDASTIDEVALTQDFVQRLEQSIRAQPENWLWTHRRWKVKPQENDNIITAT